MRVIKIFCIILLFATFLDANGRKKLPNSRERSKFQSSIVKSDIKIAVLNLKPKKIDAVSAEKISEQLRDAIRFTKKFFVVEKQVMNSVLDRKKLSDLYCHEIDCAVSIGKLLRVDKILVGSIDKTGNGYTLDTKLIDVNEKKIDIQERSDLEDKNKLNRKIIKYADFLADKLRLDPKKKYRQKWDLQNFSKGEDKGTVNMRTSVKEDSVLDIGDQVTIDVDYKIESFNKDKIYYLWLGIKPEKKYSGKAFNENKYKHYYLYKQSGTARLTYQMKEVDYKHFGNRWEINSKGEYYLVVRMKSRVEKQNIGNELAIDKVKFRRKKGRY